MSVKEELSRHKGMSELQYVVSLYSDIDLFDEYKMNATNITNQHWRVFYLILEKIVERKSITVLDEVNVDLFIAEQPKKLQKLYEGMGGFKQIEEAKAIIETGNIDLYYQEVLRYTVIERMFKQGIANEDDWKEIQAMTYDQLVMYLDGINDSIFEGINISDDEIVDLTTNMWDMVVEADKGLGKGLPVASNLLNSIINGQSLGNITMLAGNSGAGKTFLTLSLILPNVIKEEMPLLIMCNEEDVTKWQREIITWVINNVEKKDFVKSRFYQGGFTEEEWELLKSANDWLQEKIKDGKIKFVNFNTFSMSKSIGLIRKYTTQYGFKHFIIDTLKLDNDIGSKVTDIAWLQLQQNMVKLYNVIKPTNKNCHVWVTYQLNKSVRNKYLDQSSLGMSKNVADVVSTLLLVRNVLEGEKGNESTSLKVKGAKKVDKILSQDKDYMICFIDKNRQGASTDQVVWRVDKGRNLLIDTGLTRVAQDY